jgi:alkyldihydroxyacetonephosphate synthase
MFKSFRDGIDAIRETMQNGLIPEMMRLSDPDETRISLVLSSEPREFIKSVTTRLGLWLLKRLGYLSPHACLMILANEGSQASLKAERNSALQACKRHRSFVIGSGVGETWAKERYELPYLRDVLLDHCILVDTLETATTWNKLETLHGAIKKAIQNAMSSMGVTGLAFCHVSHAYRDGASLYSRRAASEGEGVPAMGKDQEGRDRLHHAQQRHTKPPPRHRKRSRTLDQAGAWQQWARASQSHEEAARSYRNNESR